MKKLMIIIGLLFVSCTALSAGMVVTNYDEGVGSGQWVQTSDTGTVETDASLLRTDDGQGLRLGSSNNLNTQADLNISLNLTGYDEFVLEYYVDQSTINSSELWIWFSNNQWHSHFYCKVQGTIQFVRIPDSKYKIQFDKSVCLGKGSPNWDSIDAIRVSIRSKPEVDFNATFDKLTAYTNNSTQAKLLITFDDGYAGAFTIAKPKLDEYAFKATAYIIMSGSSSIGANSNRLSIPQVQELYDSGWDISAHDSQDFSNATPAQALAQVQASVALIDSNGWTRASHNYAYPRGIYNQPIIDALTGFLTSARTINIAEIGLPIPLPLSINSQVADMNNTLALLEKRAQNCANHKTVCTFTFHKLNNAPGPRDEWSISDFNAFIDFIAELKANGQADVITISELNALNQGDPVLSVPVVTVKGSRVFEATEHAGSIVVFDATATDAVDGDLPAKCTPNSGSTFKLGKTSITCSATNSAGKTGILKFNVLVQDTTPPNITAHDDIIIQAKNKIDVNYDIPSTTDIVDGNGIASCIPATGSFFSRGETTVTCSATDSAGNKAVQTTFKITLTNRSGDLVLLPINDKTVDENSLLSFTVSATDYAGAILTFAAIPLPAGAGFNSETGEFNWIPKFTQAGVYNVKFSVSDDKNTTIDEDISITVTNNPNGPPVLDTIANQSVQEGSQLSFTISATNPDGGSVRFAATGLPSWLSMTDSNGIATVSGTAQGVGERTVNFAVFNDNNSSVNQDVNVTVTAIPEIPVQPPAGGGGGGGGSSGGGGGSFSAVTTPIVQPVVEPIVPPKAQPEVQPAPVKSPTIYTPNYDEPTAKTSKNKSNLSPIASQPLPIAATGLVNLGFLGNVPEIIAVIGIIALVALMAGLWFVAVRKK